MPRSGKGLPRSLCSGLQHGYPCGNPAVFAVYIKPEDAVGTCGKHLAKVTSARIAGSDVGFVKVCEI